MRLLDLFEEDKERLLAELAADRSPGAAQAALEKAVDRALYRAGEECGDPAAFRQVQAALGAMRSMLPLAGAVSEHREWQREVPAARKKGLRPLPTALLIAGLVLLAGGALSLGITGRPLVLLKAALPMLAGAACLFFAGARSAKPPKKRQDAAAVRVEYLIDPDTAWHCLRSAALVADRNIETAMEDAALERQAEQAAEPEGPLSREEIELFSGLLEAAYARRDENRDSISAMRYYLHGRQVDVVDYDGAQNGWFELLPARRTGTMRPALACGGTLLKKGLASAQEGE